MKKYDTNNHLDITPREAATICKSNNQTCDNCVLKWSGDADFITSSQCNYFRETKVHPFDIRIKKTKTVKIADMTLKQIIKNLNNVKFCNDCVLQNFCIINKVFLCGLHYTESNLNKEFEIEEDE